MPPRAVHGFTPERSCRMHYRKIAKRYAKAFFIDGIDTAAIDTMIGDVRVRISAMEDDREVRDFFESPANPKEIKATVAKNLAEKIGLSTHTLSLIKMLIKNDRMNIIGDVLEELQGMSDRIHGRIRVKLTTAYESSQKELEEISARIGDYFGQKAIVERSIDKDIIGGFVLESDDRLIDVSIRGQLNRALSEI